jgi:creatinine amidohydrolase
MLTWKNTAWDFKENPPRLAILPLAAFETHGPHLPLETDAIIMAAVARRTTELLDEPSFLLPLWPYGTSGHLAGQPGTVYLDFNTLWAVVRDLVLSLHRHHISRVVVLNNHGSAATTPTRPLGNFVVKTAVRQLNYETPGLTAIWAQPFALASQELKRLFPSAGREVHAGAVETSLIMHLSPERVGAIPEGFAPEVSPNYLDFAPLVKFAPGGVWGKPAEASAEKGEQAFAAVVNATVNYIGKTFRQLDEMKKKQAGG